ncbi:MAG TPA: DsbA family oxidoreductase [Nocardioides sp.]|uniref:DsbA family oxidoreductase n=1 Tax=uncultured Nocardioides sp. TaxID=198441 RepID=UPI000ED7EEB9|nr:DsbA family oxidoreductase [uncultured Nocardioides sp.]HCB03952.1 disulfide bond formation protein DsbA [Nocardioides sp.]HRD60573.1 DsbA family oxidoreductase [Nocardioides sp.]HRI96497.1 DsbA family oxidoreductase [Nocardioides sp.]HRK46117.1 DsbA family oxidoreductase [Nocardioides sp.]
MRIEVWSDVVCPWCYIGKRHLESALGAFEHRDQVEVVYRSFELDPTAPEVPVETTVESLAKKFGTDVAGARQLMARADGVAASVGLDFHHADAPHARTVDAHRLLHLALEEGRQAELKEALLAAYFTRGESMGDHAVLRRVAVEAGLEPSRVDEVLASEEFTDAVHADIAQARAYGANGVPFFVVDQRYGVSGAQPTEVFAQLLERAWADGHPQIEVLAGRDADACGPDGCAV